MGTVTLESSAARQLLSAHAAEIDLILAKYSAVNPRLFGSVARGDARSGSDIDLIVDLLPGAGNALLRVAGLSEELAGLLGRRVDVVSEELLRDGVSVSALADAVPL